MASLPACVQPSAFRSYQVGFHSCKALLRFADYCALSSPPSPLLPPSSSTDHLAEQYGGRHVFVDMGANWCNTLQLYSRVPQAAPFILPSSSGWEVYAFEAAPLIAPFVEKCCVELSAGRPLPSLPLPPAGSSMQLLTYATQLGCTVGGRGARLACVTKALEKPLSELRVQPSLTSNSSLLDSRLAVARRRGQRRGPRRRKRSSYTFIPSAAGAERSSFKVRTSPIQMLRGGTSSPGGPSQQHRTSDQEYTVAQVTWSSPALLLPRCFQF